VGDDIINYLIYFIQSGRKGAIKIGYTSNLERRLAELQIGNPSILHVIAALPVGSEKKAINLESSFHKLFKSQHVRGEWYSSSINIKKAMDKIGK